MCTKNNNKNKAIKRIYIISIEKQIKYYYVNIDKYYTSWHARLIYATIKFEFLYLYEFNITYIYIYIDYYL